MVLGALGLILGGLLVPLATRLEAARYERVGEQLEAARRALVGYAVAHDMQLPCPDDDALGTPGYGQPDAGTPCAVTEGWLPNVTLGVDELDPWGNRLRYAVDSDLAVGLGAPPVGAPYDLASDLVVRDLGRLSVARDGLVLAAQDTVAAVVFSCGADGRASDENNGDTPFGAASARCGMPGSWDRHYAMADIARDGFDDALVWLGLNELVLRLSSAGLWPPE